ncbi:MAG: cysteine-rich CWC family protein [Burkholderiaceae bacterium]
MSSLTNRSASPGPDPTLCPLCGRLNNCQMAAETLDQSQLPRPDCWCKSRTFPAALLAQVPTAAIGNACICPACQQAAAAAAQQ